MPWRQLAFLALPPYRVTSSFPASLLLPKGFPTYIVGNFLSGWTFTTREFAAFLGTFYGFHFEVDISDPDLANERLLTGTLSFSTGHIFLALLLLFILLRIYSTVHLKANIPDILSL